MNISASIFIILGLYGAYAAGMLYLRTNPSETTERALAQLQSFPYTTLLLIIIVAIPTTIQFIFPMLLPLLERNRDQFMAGDWWRIVTPLVVQDGGVSGSFFNLLTLYLVGRLGEAIWGGRRLLVLFWLGGILSELIALIWQPIGAGNSIANFSIAASITIWCLAQRPRPLVMFIVILTCGAYLMLLIMHDIHGAAALIGLGLGLSLLWFDRQLRQKQQRT